VEIQYLYWLIFVATFISALWAPHTFKSECKPNAWSSIWCVISRWDKQCEEWTGGRNCYIQRPASTIHFYQKYLIWVPIFPHWVKASESSSWNSSLKDNSKSDNRSMNRLRFFLAYQNDVRSEQVCRHRRGWFGLWWNGILQKRETEPDLLHLLGIPDHRSSALARTFLIQEKISNLAGLSDFQLGTFNGAWGTAWGRDNLTSNQRIGGSSPAGPTNYSF